MGNSAAKRALWNAVEKGDAGQVQQILTSHDGLVDARDQHNNTALHLAVSKGHVEVIKTLVQCKVIGDDPPDGGFTLQQLAVASGHAAVVETLFHLGCRDLDSLDYMLRTPFHIAASSARTEIIETLVRLGSNSIDRPDHLGNTPLHLACSREGHMRRSMQVIVALVRLGSRAIDTPNRDGQTPLMLALEPPYRSQFRFSTLDDGPSLLPDALMDQIDCANLLLMLGASMKGTDPEVIERRMEAFLDKNKVLQVRYRVFFSWTLLGRLLFFLQE